MRSRRAFTLIELLVVVAIIALLIALLMPALGRAKEEARLVKCEANLHAIGIALASYNNSNSDYMPSTNPIYLPDWNNGNQLMGWADQLLVDGDFKEHNDFQGRGGAGGDGTAANNNYSWHYPAWGYGVMQCPKHSSDYQWDSSDTPSDSRYLQGYAMSWCSTSNFQPVNDPNGPSATPPRPSNWWYNGARPTNMNPYIPVHSRELNQAHIIVAEGNGSMGVQGAYQVPAHMKKSSTSPNNYCYGVFERHIRNNILGGTYLMADDHAEFSSDYGWAPSPVDFHSGLTTSTVPNPNGNPFLLKSRIWVHGAADGL